MCAIVIEKTVQIQSVCDWHCYAHPQLKDLQWKDGRSAKELAKAWFRTGSAQAPEELIHLLNSHPDISGVQITKGIPEHETKLDDFKGKGRHHDLFLIGNKVGETVIITIEAKADEPFGPDIECYFKDSYNKPGSNVCLRITNLSDAIFGKSPEDDAVGKLKYQLLHAIAGTLIEAKDGNAKIAVFVIHEFLFSVDEEKVARNRDDLNNFVQLLADYSKTSVGHIEPGQLYGPFFAQGEDLKHIPLYIGKVQTR